MPRCGTNHLMDLVCSHPEVAPGRLPVKEDLFLENSEPLLRYVSQVRGAWDPIWGDFPPELEEDLLRSLGDGLISFLWTDRSRRLVTKSPSVRNIASFHRLFPDAKLLILIRDGRSIVQSCIDTFGWDFDTATHRFSDAARELLAYIEDRGASAEHLMIRYEDLVTDMRPTMTSVLEFAGLSRDGFDFAAAEELPVRGSSSHLGPGRTSVHWEPVSKNASFRPLQRWESWDEDRRARFEWLAGREARALGYELDGVEVRPTPHRLRDLRWHGMRWSRRFLYRLRGRLGPATRPLRERLRIIAIDGDG
jgi:protein-tyrosine sulfotransferase